MFGNSNERLKPIEQKKEKQTEDVFSSENNSNRGWLEPTSVQVNPSRSIDRKSKKPKEITNKKDALGAVSDEDILKLAQLTAILPEVNKPKNKNHRHLSVELQPKSEPLKDGYNSLMRIQPSDKIISNDLLPSKSSSIKSNNNNPEIIMVDGEKKRSSWLYKSIIKPYKNKHKRRSDEIMENNSDIESSSISSNHSNENQSIPVTPNTSNISATSSTLEKNLEYNNISRTHTIDIASMIHNNKTDTINRRHSFDSLQFFAIRENEDTDFLNSFHNKTTEDDINEEEKQGDGEEEIYYDDGDEEQSIQENHLKKDDEKITFKFDYYSLPNEVKSIIDEYERQGRAMKKKMMIKHTGSVEEEELEEEDDEEDMEYVDAADIIAGCVVSQDNYQPRMIAIVHALPSDAIEFKKLAQLSSSNVDNGPLLDLRISMLGDEADAHYDTIRDLLASVETQLESVETFQSKSQEFLEENQGIMERLHLADINIPSAYKYTHSELVSGEEKDFFDMKHEEMITMMSLFKKELQGLQISLKETKGLVHNIQSEMDDTRSKMETYIKDIPESHYSALKKLEVDIESILSKRAKNPWLDTGYTLLSYLLTLFALVVWTVIYILKWAKKVVLFPKKLWVTYSDYTIERNKAVRKTGAEGVPPFISNKQSAHLTQRIAKEGQKLL